MTGCCENKKTIYFVQWTKLKLFYQLQRQWSICSLNLYPESPVILGTFCMCCKPTGVARYSTLFKSSHYLVVIEPWIQKCAFYAVAKRQKRSVGSGYKHFFQFSRVYLHPLALCFTAMWLLRQFLNCMTEVSSIHFNSLF